MGGKLTLVLLLLLVSTKQRFAGVESYGSGTLAGSTRLVEDRCVTVRVPVQGQNAIGTIQTRQTPTSRKAEPIPEGRKHPMLMVAFLLTFMMRGAWENWMLILALPALADFALSISELYLRAAANITAWSD